MVLPRWNPWQWTALALILGLVALTLWILWYPIPSSFRQQVLLPGEQASEKRASMDFIFENLEIEKTVADATSWQLLAREAKLIDGRITVSDIEIREKTAEPIRVTATTAEGEVLSEQGSIELLLQNLVLGGTVEVRAYDGVRLLCKSARLDPAKRIISSSQEAILNLKEDSQPISLEWFIYDMNTGDFESASEGMKEALRQEQEEQDKGES
jgi:hypothetical protein